MDCPPQLTKEQSAGPLVPGEIVLTTIGVAVITSVSHGTDDAVNSRDVSDAEPLFFQARLWRIPGRSIGSSTTASLRRDTIIKRLPAAPGMTTKVVCSPNDSKKNGLDVMIYSYSPSTDKFLVSPVSREQESYGSLFASRKKSIASEAESDRTENNVQASQESAEKEFFEVASDEIDPARSAKFYPLINELMRRGDMAASATSALLNKSNVSKVMAKSSELIESTPTKPNVALSNESVDSIQKAIPNKDEVQQIYNMLKDEELTVLLQKGQERLRQLVSNEIPQATKIALEKSGIAITDESPESALSLSQSAIEQSREKALSALDNLLSEHADTDIETLQRELSENFTSMFDSLAQAARSDRALNSIFETVSGKTSEWQEATGRVMSTRSASLFFAGAQRLQGRAANLFSGDQLSWAAEVGDRMTKAFTEGDAAVARLKSIELGDAMRSRLVTAIEVRSGSAGGLDGIIAGALTSMNSGDLNDAAEDKMQSMLANLQKTASSATKDTHETLIVMLSNKSEYRDVAILRIEKVLVDLESYLGDELSAEEIAALARGEGGTAALFEPIARRAAQEIEKQLDVAEKSVSDPTILSVLAHVRRIISGELTMSGLLDEVVNVLNDDQVVAAGETLVKRGENVLDALEKASGNKVVEDVIEVVEKAGITKDAVMDHVEKLNINEILDTAESAVTDQKARRELISSATDSALDFLLRILPSMPVPPFDGVKDGLVYHLSNLSMQGFKVLKEDIVVEIAGIRAKKTEQPPPDDSPNNVDLEGRKPDIVGDNAESVASGASDAGSNSSYDTASVFDEEEVSPNPVKPTELLIIDVRNISAMLDDAVWSFEQTYLPYLKGKGKADVRLWNGRIRLQFELRRRKVEKNESTSPEGDDSEWEPVLCLHNRTCTIGEVDLILQGEGRITWILNKLANLFRVPLRDYVVRVIMNILTNKSGVLLSMLNENLSPYWALILRTAGFSMEDLVEITEDDVTNIIPDEHENEVELVWREHLPLGMNLLMNDESGLLKVVDFPRGSQARDVALHKKVDPEVFNGATIIAVNGRRYDTQDELVDALRDPGRPKTVHFELANAEDAERIRRFVGGADANEPKAPPPSNVHEDAMSVRTVEIVETGELGIQFSGSLDDVGLVVRCFLRGENGEKLAAENSGLVVSGNLLSHINGVLVLGENGAGRKRALSIFEEVGGIRPLSLGFIKPYLDLQVFEKTSTDEPDFGGPIELVLEEKKLPSGGTKVVVKSFANVDGMAESGGVYIGDHLVFINGLPVGAGCRLFQDEHRPGLEEAMSMLEDAGSYPVALTFGRPGQGQSRWLASSNAFDMESAETFCVTANSFDELGCKFGTGQDADDIVVTDIHGVPGPFQDKLSPFIESKENMNLSIESINGQVVPSYATPDMVLNAMKRSWSSDARVEVLFCHDARRDWVMNMILSSDKS